MDSKATSLLSWSGSQPGSFCVFFFRWEDQKKHLRFCSCFFFPLCGVRFWEGYIFYILHDAICTMCSNYINLLHIKSYVHFQNYLRYTVSDTRLSAPSNSPSRCPASILPTLPGSSVKYAEGGRRNGRKVPPSHRFACLMFGFFFF